MNDPLTACLNAPLGLLRNYFSSTELSQSFYIFGTENTIYERINNFNVN